MKFSLYYIDILTYIVNILPLFVLINKRKVLCLSTQIHEYFSLKH